MGWAAFWATFSQTHLVTLDPKSHILIVSRSFFLIGGTAAAKKWRKMLGGNKNF
jgi:hypothetical protein